MFSSSGLRVHLYLKKIITDTSRFVILGEVDKGLLADGVEVFRNFFFSVIVSLFTIQKSVICSLSLQTVSLSGPFCTLRFCPWISGRDIVLKDMVLWCCQHLQVKKNKHLWGSMLSAQGNGSWVVLFGTAAPSSGRLYLCFLKWTVCCLWRSRVMWCVLHLPSCWEVLCFTVLALPVVLLGNCMW